jgi:hypothetical protein
MQDIEVAGISQQVWRGLCKPVSEAKVGSGSPAEVPIVRTAHPQYFETSLNRHDAALTLRADFVAKVFLHWQSKILLAVDATFV